MFALPPQSEPRCFVMSYGYEPRNASPTPSHDRNSSKHKTLKTHSNNMTIVLWLATPYAHAHLFLALSSRDTALARCPRRRRCYLTRLLSSLSAVNLEPFVRMSLSGFQQQTTWPYYLFILSNRSPAIHHQSASTNDDLGRPRSQQHILSHQFPVSIISSTSLFIHINNQGIKIALRSVLCI